MSNKRDKESRPKLTEKQKRFCQEYLVGLNATQAAIRAGYSKKTANEQGSQNLAKLSIQGYIQKLIAKRAERTQIDADYVIESIREIVEAPGTKESDQLRGLELLGKHLAMFTDKHRHSGKIDLMQLMSEQGEAMNGS